MASTNKTTHYELSQFLGTDKPAWLADYNSDMSKIDAGINTAQTTATGADGKADTVSTNLGNIENLTTSTKTSAVAAINEVDGHADLAQETANSASDAANIATGKVNDLADYFNLQYHSTITVSISGSGSPAITSSEIRSAYNDDGTLGKIYGRIDWNKQGVSSTITINFSDTGLRPAEAITINAAGFMAVYDGTYHTTTVKSVDLVIATDGTASIQFSSSSSEAGGQIIFTPFVIFAQNFGD